MAVASIPGIELGAELGRGSHSVVLRGTREGQTYAVKLPLDASSGADRDLAYRRFLREAVALARVRDASLPGVMEVGPAGGMPYLVMELAAGETLADRLERGPLRETDVLGLARQLASALRAIHGAGLIHRDVKPRNIVFDSRTGVARLIDLGSAALAHTAVGGVGTRAYAAPELLTDEPRAADARTDLYSFGRVLVECLTGRSPYGGSNGAGDRAALGKEPSGLVQIITRLIENEPSQRYATADEVLRELDRIAPVEASAHIQVRGRGPLLGRNAELDQLRKAWADTRRGSRIVFLEGSPGAGKTRLAQVFLGDVAETRATVFTAACHPRDPRPFSAVRQLIDSYLRRCDELPAPDRLKALSEIRRLGGEHGSLLRLLSPVLSRVFREAPTIPASANAEQAFAEAVAEFLGKLIKRAAPVVVFVDDVQWLDPSSRRALARCIALVPKRAMFLFGARSGESSADVHRFSDLLTVKKTIIEIGALEGGDLAEIAREFLSAKELTAEVKAAVLRLSDGTPLSVLELLRTLVDEGALLPHWGVWQLDPKALTAMHLPRETAKLLERRIGALDAATRSVLSGAAVIGMVFDERLLASASGVDAQVVTSALVEAQRADLTEALGEYGHRFIHHTVRDALIDALDGTATHEINQRIGEALDAARAARKDTQFRFEVEKGAAPSDDVRLSVGHEGADETEDADWLYRVAYHYAAGVPGRSPDRASLANIAAGEAAVARFDNERAIEFFEAAERALALTGASLSPTIRLSLGDARLRSGALNQALEDFDRILSTSEDQLLRAGAYLRIATVHDMRFDSNRAWEALERAFDALGESLPRETPRDVALTLAAWLRRGVARVKSAVSTSRARDEMLCELYYQAGRVAFTSGAPGRLALATLRTLEPAERLGPSPQLVKAHLLYAFLLTVSGFSKKGHEYVTEAQRQVAELRDPVAFSHALQIEHVIAAWGGRMQDAIDAGSRCLIEYGNWRELSEVCFLSWSMYQVETIRGRHFAAWKWLDLPIQRVNQHTGEPVVHEFLLLAARGALLGLGRENEVAMLLRRLAQVTVPVPKDSKTYAWTFGPRARLFTERAAFGPEFEALTREFQSLGQNPKEAHLSAFEYYLHVAHARVHQCLRSKPEGRLACLGELERARMDLEAAARKIPLFRAHAVAVLGYEHFFRTHKSQALETFEQAERLAVAENAPWVLYAVHRGRAHLLRSDGQEAAAQDQAVAAESLARQHGSVFRARWIHEEFELRPGLSSRGSDETMARPIEAPVTTETTSFVPAAGARRQLRALLRISQARAQELDPDLQARLVVDELVQALRAERGFLFLTPAIANAAIESTQGRGGEAGLELIAGRDASGRELGPSTDYDQGTVRGAEEMGPDAASASEITASFCVGTTARRSALAAPVIVDELTAGVVYVDRLLVDGAFTESDGEVLAALAGQVSIALELTRVLRERERAQAASRAADKMEAVARLARGVGHDVNNMLSAVTLTIAAIAETPGISDLVGEDIRAMEGVLKGAGELTRKLRDIAQGDLGRPEQIRPSERVRRLMPVLTGILGNGIVLETRLASSASIFIDPGQLDQIVANLAGNARDAMPNGGRLTIEIDQVFLDETYVREHPGVVPAAYVRLSVTDTGHGMDADVREKIFDPYFTTKRSRGGTGLGLSSVYWFVSRSGGHIDVVSSPGAGSTFTLYFPVVGEQVAEAEGSRIRGLSRSES